MGDPVAVNVNWQPAVSEAKVPAHVSPVLAVTVADPVGVPDPLTVKLTVTAWPTDEGLELLELITVVLAASFTVSATVSVAEV